MTASTPTQLTDLQLLLSLASYAGQTNDEHLLLPVFRSKSMPRDIAQQLRDMANRIEHPDGIYFDPLKCNCAEGDAANHPGDCTAWIGDHHGPTGDGGYRIDHA
jgi:hypothetical protein